MYYYEHGKIKLSKNLMILLQEMTRGMKGCYVYCVDEGLSNYLKECLKDNV